MVKDRFTDKEWEVVTVTKHLNKMKYVTITDFPKLPQFNHATVDPNGTVYLSGTIGCDTQYKVCMYIYVCVYVGMNGCMDICIT